MILTLLLVGYVRGTWPDIKCWTSDLTSCFFTLLHVCHDTVLMACVFPVVCGYSNELSDSSFYCWENGFSCFVEDTDG